MKKQLTINNQQLIRKPLVSVIMPVYNAEEFLVPAIRSILKQTYKRFELIIVDDASTDSSWNIIETFRRMHPKKIKTFHIRKQTNSAGNGAVNYGLKRAKGQYIARMDADDIAYRKRLEKQVVYMEEHPGTIVLGTQADVVNKEGQIVGQKKAPLTHSLIYLLYGMIHPMIHPSCMFRRAYLPKRNRLYENLYGVNDDYYTFFRLLNRGQFANLPEVLLKYRVHGKNSSLIHLRSKCLSTVKIRLMAINNFDYQMPIWAYPVMLTQFIIALVTPEPLLQFAYLSLRGFSKVEFKVNLPDLFLFKRFKTSVK